MSEYPRCETCEHWHPEEVDDAEVGRCSAYSKDDDVVRLVADVSLPGRAEFFMALHGHDVSGEVHAETPASHGCIHHSDLHNDE